MGSKYTTQLASGYNSSPPVDDGSSTEANKVKWSTIKTKLADVLKTLAESINTALLTALDQSCRAVAVNDSAGASDHDRTIQVNTSSVTITLADATTMAAGYTVSIANQSTGNISVALATATDTIDTVTNATVTISAKEVRRYIVNTTANGYITASDRVVAASDTIAGKIELATQAEVSAMTDTSRAVTPNHNKIILGTEQASTSGTSIDFTGIPAGVRRITVNFVGVSETGSDTLIIQLGDSGGVETSGYVGATSSQGGSTTNFTSGFIVSSVSAGTVLSGSYTFDLQDASDFTWTGRGTVGHSNAASIFYGAGHKSLSAELDRVRITTAGGTPTFDAGSINISYER